MKLSRNILCLDWDQRWLRLVVARVGKGQIALQDAHAHRLPATVDPASPETLGQFIQQMLKRHRLSFKRCVVDVPRERAVINRLTLPPTPPNELAAAVRFQAMKELPFPLDEAVVDYVEMQRDEQGRVTEVLVAAITRETLAAMQATCTAAGLEPVRIGLRPYSNLISVVHLAGLAEQRVLFVDVGAVMTEIDVVEAGRLAFARTANVVLPLPAEGAGDESRIITLADLGDVNAADAAIENAVNELALETTRTLQAYRSTAPDAVISRIIVAGGSGIEPLLVQTLAQRFDTSATLFDPTEALGAPPEDAGKLRTFSAALGMAWSFSREGLIELDFANPKRPVPAGQVLKRRLKVAGLAAAVVLAVAIATDAALYLQRREVLKTQQSAISDLRKQLREAIGVENAVEEIQDWQYEAVWPEHLLRLSEAVSEPGQDLLFQQMVLNGAGGSISLKKVLVADKDKPIEFVAALNGLEVDKRHPYRARQGTYTSLRGMGKFDGRVDIEVTLTDIQEHEAKRDARTRARKDKLRGY